MVKGGSAIGPPAANSRALGIDIGGAHIKLANALGESAVLEFPMWSRFEELSEVVSDMVARFEGEKGGTYSELAITMTGEMADCFPSRAVGVEFILGKAAEALPGLRLWVYSVDGNWLDPRAALERPWDVAASNWHALARWIAETVVDRDENLQLVLDVGSTTVDVIPIRNGQVATRARCDSDRLKLRQLVYTGVGRTPIASILPFAVIDGREWPLVAERFACSEDAYLALGLFPPTDMEGGLEKNLDAGPCEQSWGFSLDETIVGSTGIVRYGLDSPTADGRPRTVNAACARLARMLGEDSERLREGELLSLARQVVAEQARQVSRAIAENLVVSPLPQARALIAISGHGPLLAQAAIQDLPMQVDCISLSDRISPSAARCAPAVAVAWLLEQHLLSQSDSIVARSI